MFTLDNPLNIATKYFWLLRYYYHCYNLFYYHCIDLPLILKVLQVRFGICLRGRAENSKREHDFELTKKLCQFPLCSPPRYDFLLLTCRQEGFPDLIREEIT